MNRGFFGKNEEKAFIKRPNVVYIKRKSVIGIGNLNIMRGKAMEYLTDTAQITG